jgi:cell wall assembly regulator SMI1
MRENWFSVFGFRPKRIADTENRKRKTENRRGALAMQQFTRNLTREIEVGGERLALTLSKEGLSVRPVGGRRPPHTMSWAACLCACVSGAGHEPAAEQVKQALESVRAGAAKADKEAPSGGHKPPETSDTAPSGGRKPPETSETRGAYAPRSDADKMTVLLARLDQWLNAERERFQQALRPGATAAECDALASDLGKPLPEELRALLMWHNGQTPDVPGAFEQSWMLLSTEEIAEAKKELDEHPHEGWQKDWLPFLGDDNGDYRCLNLGSPGCPVLECWRGRADHPVIAPSLSAWLESFVAALERGAYVEDPERGTLALKEGIGNRA